MCLNFQTEVVEYLLHQSLSKFTPNTYCAVMLVICHNAAQLKRRHIPFLALNITCLHFLFFPFFFLSLLFESSGVLTELRNTAKSDGEVFTAAPRGKGLYVELYSFNIRWCIKWYTNAKNDKWHDFLKQPL